MSTPKSLQFEIFDQPNEIFTKAKIAASEYGMQFLGDDVCGIIKGAGLEANYILENGLLTVTVFRKPMLLSWTKIEQKLKTFVGAI